VNKKTLIILFLALVLVSGLFVTSLGLGGRRQGSGPTFNIRSPGMERISGWFTRPAKVEHLSPLSGRSEDCRLDVSRITVRAGRTCVFAVAADRFLTRRLTLARPPSEEREGRLNVTLEQSLKGQKNPMKFDRFLATGSTADPFDIYGRKDSAAILRITGRGLPFIDPEEYVIDIK
jgi:hypothetical protein